ncbi:2Fe-2S iron-sulfur cluster-binding protein [Lacisediminihabitans profunda]|uniref:2Fe-2S iron-sulfur cluster binding domain-containing protein n=1 Tax=Lacisediminihabitans profunda TaxID=2594790 RepID=A0A5C8UP41_9MICO|nr:2Fe-2S iron-sulfur cluster-binding protein [Lacisediminihabitans profunda]TXN30013.1 2Fe-2S iron-sulfur cluster binding domain-containing protein [Lacisediminihabitans profunda]
MTSPHLWWYITRASAIIAWALMTLSVVWGTLLSTRVLRKVDNPSWLQDLHRYLGGTAIVMVVAHMVSLMLDGWLHFSAAAVLVPFATDYRALPVAIGILAFYLLLAVQGSSLLMRLLPRRFWKGVHYASYLVVVLVSFHAGLTGTDVGALWYRVVAISIIGLSVIAVLVRVIAGNRAAGNRVAGNRAPGRSDAVRRERPGSAPVRRGVTMRVSATFRVSDEVLGIRLVPSAATVLPVWRPGAHVTVALPNGLERQYSLCGDPADRSHFDIAVLRTLDSQGGSSWIHANVRPGVQLEVTGPLNHFELEPALSYLFVAGGIGITPIKSMIESLPDRRDWHLLYFGRSRRSMAFADELAAEYPGRVWVHASDENATALDIEHLLSTVDADVYCCGPESLMARVASVVPRERMHLERFTPVERAAIGAPQSVRVTCRKSRKDFAVPSGQSILDALEQNGLPVMGSCRKGVCGTCEVRVVGGLPEHLDSVVDDEEKDRLGVMYPCVSRATTPELVLDI